MCSFPEEVHFPLVVNCSSLLPWDWVMVRVQQGPHPTTTKRKRILLWRKYRNIRQGCFHYVQRSHLLAHHCEKVSVLVILMEILSLHVSCWWFLRTEITVGCTYVTISQSNPLLLMTLTLPATHLQEKAVLLPISASSFQDFIAAA